MPVEGNSLRDEMKDNIKGYLSDYFHIPEDDVDADMVADLADQAFDVVKIPERAQDMPYEKFSAIELTFSEEGKPENDHA